MSAGAPGAPRTRILPADPKHPRSHAVSPTGADCVDDVKRVEAHPHTAADAAAAASATKTCSMPFHRWRRARVSSVVRPCKVAAATPPSPLCALSQSSPGAAAQCAVSSYPLTSTYCSCATAEHSPCLQVLDACTLLARWRSFTLLSRSVSGSTPTVVPALAGHRDEDFTVAGWPGHGHGIWASAGCPQHRSRPR